MKKFLNAAYCYHDRPAQKYHNLKSILNLSFSIEIRASTPVNAYCSDNAIPLQFLSPAVGDIQHIKTNTYVFGNLSESRHSVIFLY